MIPIQLLYTQSTCPRIPTRPLRLIRRFAHLHLIQGAAAIGIFAQALGPSIDHFIFAAQGCLLLPITANGTRCVYHALSGKGRAKSRLAIPYENLAICLRFKSESSNKDPCSRQSAVGKLYRLLNRL
jgi:hypothetical protein